MPENSAPIILPVGSTYDARTGILRYRRGLYRVVSNGREFRAECRAVWWPFWMNVIPWARDTANYAWDDIAYRLHLRLPWRTTRAETS